MRVPRSQVVGSTLRGTPIGDRVTAYPLESREIVVLGPTTSFWEIQSHEFHSWIASVKSEHGFVWLDPPKGNDGRSVEEALKAAGIPVRYKARAADDAIVSEVVAATPAQVTETIREVVMDMVDDAVEGWPHTNQDRLDLVIDEVLSAEGL